MDSNKQLVVTTLFCILLVITAVAGTVIRNRIWQSPESLSNDILKKKNSSLRVHEQAVCGLAQGMLRDKNSRQALEFMKGPDAEDCPRGDRYNYTMAKLNFINSSIREAEGYLEQIKHDPRFISRACYVKGMIALRAGNEDEALQLFKQSLELDKQYWYSLYRIARIQRKKGDILKAIFSLYRIITVMPDNLEVNREFAHLLYELAKEQKKKGEAFRAKSLFLDGVASLKQVIEKGSADKKLKLFYMDILIAAEYIQDAQEYIDRLYRNYPDDPAIIERYVRYYNSFLQYRKAEELCEELNRLTGEENLNVLFLLGEIYYKRRRLEKALNVLTRCLEKSRELGFKKSEHAALNNLAQIDMYVGDYENARRKYSDILKRDRTFWQAQAGLAEVYIRKEEFSKAEQAVTELTKLVPETYFTLVKLKAMLEEGKRREQYRKRYRDQKSHS